MTNSPPSKLIFNGITPGNIKASGIDTLFISFSGEWKNLEWFSYFAELKKRAQESFTDCPGVIQVSHTWKFNTKPNGTQGFEWLLTSKDFTLKIGKWETSKSRPNILAEIRSEMLWRVGAKESASFISMMLSEMGFDIEIVKPSRVDLCIDLLYPKSAWDKELVEYAITRATERALYLQKAGKPKGFTFGRGDIMARLYDKGLEIATQSQKNWMYVIWGIDAVPPHQIMLRVEFQLRREPLKELGVNTLTDLFENQQNLWAYCTKKWLRFEDCIKAYRLKRKTMSWWLIVQDGYTNAQGANPAIREKILQPDIAQLTRQAFGLMLSIMACNLELSKAGEDRIKLEQVLHIFIDWIIRLGKTPDEMNDAIAQRRIKFKHVLTEEKQK